MAALIKLHRASTRSSAGECRDKASLLQNSQAHRIIGNLALLDLSCLAAKLCCSCRSHRFSSLWLVNNHSYVTLAAPPSTVVTLRSGLDGPTCGVVPVGAPPSAITTTGLRWNLAPEMHLAYGGIVSSSNHAEAADVTVTTDRAVLFTAELHLEACIEAMRAGGAEAGGRS